ncbi:MAG TPA: trimeric intracellular cation channel family protein [Ilumatobacter sp.]|nr:trimeric intracellular cation channel family protein [Ilumatobacter sp.]
MNTVAALGIDAGVERALELVGIVAFAVSGGLMAVRKGFDLVGVLVLSVVTALGGGAIRDLLLGATPPAAVTDGWYLTLSCATGLVMMVAHHWVHQGVRRTVLVFDAAGLGLFCVTGTLKAIDFQVGVPGAIALGVVTASGGGVLRDVLAGEQPQMFRADSVLYSIPAALGAGAIVAVTEADRYAAWLGVAIAAAVFLLRVAALKFRWRAPRPRHLVP